MTRHIFYVTVFIFLTAVSCNNEAEELINVDETIISIEEPRNHKPESIIVYSIPSPNEQFDLLYLLNDQVNPRLTNPLSNLSKYSSANEKALNFGVYLADVAYLSRYKLDHKTFLEYNAALEFLCESIGLTSFYRVQLNEKIKSKKQASDSILGYFEITSQNFISIHNELTDKNKKTELALVLSGAWVETMHVLFAKAQKFGEYPEIQAKIVDQRYTLENLMIYLDKFKENDRIRSINKEFEKISEVFIKLDCENSDLEIENKDGIMVLNGGSTCVFDSDSFQEMKSLIGVLRTSIIS